MELQEGADKYAVFALNLVSKNKKVQNENINTLKKTKPFNDEELQKFMEAIYYAMWSADGEECQFAFIDVVCKLIYCRPTEEESVKYIDSIFSILVDKWPGIDQHRVDKFYKLIRNFLYETFVFLHKSEWKSELVDSFVEILEKIFTNVEEGVKNHILDIFFEELNVADKSIPSETLKQFFTFFLDHFIVENKFEVKRYVDDIFKGLINNYELVSDDNNNNNKNNSDADKKKKKKKNSKKQKKGENDKDNENETQKEETQEEEEERKIFYNCDIRDYLQLLFTYASIKKMTGKRRKVLYEIYNEYKNKAIELFPQSGVPDVVIPEETAENLEEIEKINEIKESNIEEEESFDEDEDNENEDNNNEDNNNEENEEEEEEEEEEMEEEKPKKRKKVTFNEVALDENNKPYTKKPKIRYPNVKKQKAKMVKVKMPKRRVGKKRRKV